jgi:hypothetical protein
MLGCLCLWAKFGPSAACRKVSPRRFSPEGALEVLAGENHYAHLFFERDFACPTAPGQLSSERLRKANSYQ